MANYYDAPAWNRRLIQTPDQPIPEHCYSRPGQLPAGGVPHPANDRSPTERAPAAPPFPANPGGRHD